jgi:non-ribosomal peptide synthetase component E (peptide arylation enzyme)
MQSAQQTTLGTKFNFAQYLAQTNQHRLEKLAYIDDYSQITYKELFEKVSKLSAALQQIGIRPRGKSIAPHARY